MPKRNKRAQEKAEAQKNCCNEIKSKLHAGACIQESTATEKNGKRFEIQRKSNPQETICKLDVDCWIPITDNNQKKCDTIFIRCKENEYYFVELKGSGESDLDKVYRQITDTIDRVKEASITISLLEGYIIGAKSTVQSTLKYRQYQQKFKRDYQGELFRYSRQYTKTI
jgi:hypothetical protein